MTLDITEQDQIDLPGYGLIIAGTIQIDMGHYGDHCTPPEPPGIEGGTLTTEDGSTLDVAVLSEDVATYDLLMEQVWTLLASLPEESDPWL